MLKKSVFAIVAILLYLISFGGSVLPNSVYAQDNSGYTSEDIENIVHDSLEAIDFSNLEDALNNLTQIPNGLFENSSFYDKVVSFINGDVHLDIGAVFEAVLSLFFDNSLQIIPILVMIIAVAILCSLLSNLKSAFSGGGVKDIVHFVCYGAIIIIVASLIATCISECANVLGSLQKQMQAIFPVLLTLITAIGGLTTVSVFQPMVIILSSGVVTLFNVVLLPLFLISFIFTIANNLSNNAYFAKFADVSQSIFKWAIGIIFMLFFAFMSINGIVAGSYDGLSIKTAKYSMKSIIPYIGGYMSEGIDIVLASSALIKNAVGACGLILLIATIAVPLIKLIIIMLGLKITGAILEPITDKRISNFVFSVGKILKMLVACIVSVAIMYFLSVGMLMSVCNLF